MGRKLTTEEFIRNAVKIHGDKYNYSEVRYDGNKIKVKIICKEHGEFWQKPNNHTSLQHGCPKCKARKISEIWSMSEEEFIEKAKIVHGNKYIYENVNYTKSTEKVNIQCKKHSKFTQEANSHLQGRGCPICGVENNTKLPKELRPFMKKVKGLVQQSYFRRGFSKKSRTHQILGCDWDTFKNHLESNPYGFTVDQEGLDLDHITPISSANSEEELVKLNHYTNFQLLPSKYNQNIKRTNKFNKNHFENWLITTNYLN